MKKTLLVLALVIVAFGCFAQTPAHPNWITFTRNSPTTGTIKWSAEPSANVNYYYLALHPTGTPYSGPSYCDPDWNVPGGPAASFTLDSPGVYKSDVNALNPGLDYYAYVAAVNTAAGWSWGAFSSWESVTLPVELSSFAAVLTAEYFVNLTWITESEIELLGFNVLRGETANATEAVLLNTGLIPATNSSTTHTYTLVDEEVENEQTYYYWLQSIELNGSNQLHGPQSVTLNAPPNNTLPQISRMGNAYPNPFNADANTNIDITIKENETGSLTVYNVRGQIMTSTEYTAGEHRFTWSGKDCPSGVYFYKLNTPSTSLVKKMIVVR